MFTGIVEEVGRVVVLRIHGPQVSLTIEAQRILEGTQLGDSIAINGVCLTVRHMDRRTFTVDLTPETLRRSSLGQLKTGSDVNLERAVQAGGRMGGHYVQGHVDDVGQIVSMQPEADSIIVRFSAPVHLLRYVVEKGFIAVDGVSLTVVAIDEAGFAVALVRYTQDTIILTHQRPGTQVNLEVDILAKYAEKLLGLAPAHQEAGGPAPVERHSRAELTETHLRSYGY